MRATIAVTCIALLGLGAGACGEDDEPGSPGTTGETSTLQSSTTTSTTTDSTVPESTSTTSTGSTTGATSTTTEDDTGLPKQRCPGAERPPNITNVISYGTDCGAVEAAMAEIESVSTSFRIGDFRCSLRSGNELSGVWECLGEASYFTFVFGD